LGAFDHLIRTPAPVSAKVEKKQKQAETA
jgi:hypothetical protein